MPSPPRGTVVFSLQLPDAPGSTAARLKNAPAQNLFLARSYMRVLQLNLNAIGVSARTVDAAVKYSTPGRTRYESLGAGLSFR